MFLGFSTFQSRTQFYTFKLNLACFGLLQTISVHSTSVKLCQDYNRGTGVFSSIDVCCRRLVTNLELDLFYVPLSNLFFLLCIFQSSRLSSLITPLKGEKNATETFCCIFVCYDFKLRLKGINKFNLRNEYK